MASKSQKYLQKGSVRKSEGHKSKITMFWVLIVTFLMVGSIFSIMMMNPSGGEGPKSVKFNGFDFKRTNIKGQNYWVTDYYKKPLLLANDPLDLDREGFFDQVKNLSWGKDLSPVNAFRKVYFTFYSNNSDASLLGGFDSVFSNNFKNINILCVEAFMDHNLKAVSAETVNCNNSDNSTLVVEFMSSTDNLLSNKRNCIIVHYVDQYSMVKYAEAIEAAMLGLIHVG
ncbi:MAG: hypothetical protein GWP09_01030 [Nitrospiraceae bacterium]|nr:hypothetical protein [Nitrospiraceae bacterium]